MTKAHTERCCPSHLPRMDPVPSNSTALGAVAMQVTVGVMSVCESTSPLCACSSGYALCSRHVFCLTISVSPAPSALSPPPPPPPVSICIFPSLCAHLPLCLLAVYFSPSLSYSLFLSPFLSFFPPSPLLLLLFLFSLLPLPPSSFILFLSVALSPPPSLFLSLSHFKISCDSASITPFQSQMTNHSRLFSTVGDAPPDQDPDSLIWV